MTKKKNTKTVYKSELKTRVAIILDRSSSMDSIRGETISAFNEQVDAIRKGSEEMDTRVSLVTFATGVDDPVIWNKPVDSLKKLTKADYQPNGMTSMYDAVGLTIDKLRALPEAEDKNTSFLVVIISDGFENNSKEYNSELISSRVKKLQDSERWTFTYLGANQDLAQVAKDTGIHLDNMMTFEANSAGVLRASAINSDATSTYFSARAIGATATAGFYSDVKDKTKTTKTKTS